MDGVLRATAIYLFLLVLFRALGKRTLAQITTFDFVLLLVISEATQQALLGEDFSVTMAIIVIATLVGIEVGLRVAKTHLPVLSSWIDGRPVLIVDRGRPLHDRLRRESIDEADILAAARETQGLERMDQVRYAVLEVSGAISIIPERGASEQPDTHHLDEHHPDKQGDSP
ncbi:MAG: DUF421 domain-containing protein [Acidimicrobiales bacterium]